MISLRGIEKVYPLKGGVFYALRNINLTINEDRAEEIDLFEDKFSLRTGGGRDVTVDLPDSGRRVTFTYSLVPGGLFKLRAIWTAPRRSTVSSSCVTSEL